jgi:protein CpxP
MKAIKLLATGALLIGAAGMVVPGMAADAGKSCKDGYHLDKFAGHSGKHAGRFGRGLDLSDAQKETLKAQREANKAAHIAAKDQLKAAHIALNTAVEAGANEAELNALAETLGRLHAQQALAGAKNQQAFLAVLTDEQKQTLAEFKAKRLERKEFRKDARDSKTDRKSS